MQRLQVQIVLFVTPAVNMAFVRQSLAHKLQISVVSRSSLCDIGKVRGEGRGMGRARVGHVLEEIGR